MPLFSLIEYGSNYSEAAGSLWFYSKDETTDSNGDIANTNNFKSFTEADHANEILKNTKVVVPLKYLSNFPRSLKTSLINYKVELKLKWTRYCVLFAAGTDNLNGNDDDNNIIFTIKETKLYVLIVTLSARSNQKLSISLSKRFERSVY